MRKRIIAFYDVLPFAIICIPMIVTMVYILLFMLLTRNYQNWVIVVIFAVTFMVPIGWSMMLRFCVYYDNSIHFHYFPFTKSRENILNNIDINWNQRVEVSDINNIEVVKLSEEDKQTKVYYKHWFNKYLKITLKYDNAKYGNVKYIYVGNYSNKQIKRIIKLAKKE